MVTHTISDVLYGIIRFRREDVTTGEFLLDQSITIANDDLINIVEEYTSDSNGGVSKTIFTGRITNVDYQKAQYIHAVDVGDELDQVRPSGDYYGYTEVVLGEVVNDSSLANITCTVTSADTTILPDTDVIGGTWEDDTGGDSDADLFDELIDSNDATYIRTSGGSNDECEFSFAAHGLSATYNYNIYRIDIITKARIVGALGHLNVYFYNGTSYETKDEVGLTAGFANYTSTYYVNLTQDDVTNLKIKYTSDLDATTDISEVSMKIYYRSYQNLKKGTVKATYNFDGNSSIKEILKALSITELYTWYYDPDLELHFDDGATTSGEALIVADKMRNIVGERQVMSYDKVVLYGAYSGGAQITSTRGAGDIIWRDNYLNITEQAALDALADQILVEQGANTVKIQMVRVDSADGIYQVGETISIGAININFSGSDRIIPNSTTYIFNKIDYIIANGVYSMLDIEFIDGLLFTTPKEDEVGIIQNDTTNNAAGVAQVAGGESVGQANTASNIGTDGVGVYDSKSGVTLQFRNIAPASAKITVTENGDDIDIDVGDIDSVIEGIITAELVGGQSIDNAIDTLIAATYTNVEIDNLLHVAFVQADADALYSVLAHDGGVVEDYHDMSTLEFGDLNQMAKYTDAEANTRADARIVVQSTHPAGTIDIATDQLIANHAGDADAHLDRYTKAEVNAVIDADIVTHKNDDDAHHEVFEAADYAVAIGIHSALPNDHHVPTVKYTAAEVDARIVVQNTHPGGTTDIATDQLIANHSALPNDHHVPTVKYTDAEALAASKIKEYYAPINAGVSGFVEYALQGSCYVVAFADTSAYAEANLYIMDGGSFKVSVVHSGSGNNVGLDAGGVLHVNYAPTASSDAWDINGAAFDLDLGQNNILMIKEYGTPFTVADNSKIGLAWGKDDNAEAATGNMFVFGFVLKRQ